MSEAEKYTGYSDDGIGLFSSSNEKKGKKLETPMKKFVQGVI